MPQSPVRNKSEWELIREKNVKVLDDFFLSLVKNDPDFEDAVKILSNKNNPTVKKPRIRKNPDQDPTFRCSTSAPLERRRSARLQNRAPEVIDSEAMKRKTSDSDDDDLEEVVYKPKKRRMTNVNRRSTHVIVSPDDIKENMIKNIVKKSKEKIYSPKQGTCCHQCRQKTMDQKTCCRNTDCSGVRGQFCGICLFNRYGEIASEALKDPNWHCPVCRGICNCSICRANAGKRPTGVLAPMAQQAGHKSVKDFLDSLNGVGDYANQDLPQNNEEPDDLLGFSNNGSIAHMSDVQRTVEAVVDSGKLKDICQKQENKLKLIKEEYDESLNLLGFRCDSNIALLEDNVEYELVSLFSMPNLEADKHSLLSVAENTIIKTEKSDIYQKQDKLPLVKEEYDESHELLGFDHVSNTDVLENNTEYGAMPLLHPNDLDDVDERMKSPLSEIELKMAIELEEPVLSYADAHCDRCGENHCVCHIKTEELPPCLSPQLNFVSVLDYTNPIIKQECTGEASSSLAIHCLSELDYSDPLAIDPYDDAVIEPLPQLISFPLNRFESFYTNKIAEI